MIVLWIFSLGTKTVFSLPIFPCSVAVFLFCWYSKYTKSYFILDIVMGYWQPRNIINYVGMIRAGLDFHYSWSTRISCQSLHKSFSKGKNTKSYWVHLRFLLLNISFICLFFHWVFRDFQFAVRIELCYNLWINFSSVPVKYYSRT